jgi:hypothetical protein
MIAISNNGRANVVIADMILFVPSERNWGERSVSKRNPLHAMVLGIDDMHPAAAVDS